MQRTVEKALAREKLCAGVFELVTFRYLLLFSGFVEQFVARVLGWEGYGS